ncbi:MULTISPECIES: NAD(P)-dependent alcohol dehydrogenase [Streptomyces]|uniref:NAD(P)-dependent alcohol dehydrogenase n=1 Tax=Streptomyces TaxID=1883 RepID=UPI000B2955AA|nr:MULTISPECIES: NAD(P)-dependent alcohol dehydrogenase [Streptomyces]MDX2922607.1 NAD(P)-dependent alcohol dehydrogenase [Streptomyces sp. NE06-03C]MDX3610887.1 NAD(P)-dependent alcohol dehydrogenase [Streptomyces sp. FL06-04B]MDX3734822.1 NAD(P)-dependent alcohol dehydrogenase [Streptomyces sp. ID01-15D]
MNDMRAALHDSYGPPEVLYEGRVPVPVRKPGEVLVRVHAASVNGGELYGRAGKVRLVTGRRFPQRTGLDFTGEVAEVDASVPGLRVGDRVWGILGRSFGSAAEYVAVRPRQIAYAPGNVTLTEAASLPAGGTTSLTALRDKAGLRAGERLLVRGASGGVGSVAVQLGKAFGAHVTGLVSAKNADFVRELGADEVLDHRATPLAKLDRYDVIMDTVGTEHRLLRNRLAPGGRLVSIAFDIDHPVRSIGYLLGSAVHGRQRVRFFSGNPKHDLFAELTAYVERGDLRPVVDTVHPLAGIAAAHRALEAGGVRGKHVIQLV